MSSNIGVLITGASRGIGQAIFKKLEKENYDVVGIATQSKGEKILGCDISDINELKLTLDKIKERRKISIIINNAGIVNDNTITNMDMDDWYNIFNVNFFAPVFIIRSFIDQMILNRFGKIINISSIAGRLYSKTASAAYTSSKYALNGLTKQIAFDYAKYNIQTNSICPSQTMTEMLSKNVSKDKIKYLEDENPSRRLLETSEIAELVYFLISSKVTYLNGTCIDLNGGIL